VYLTHPSYRTRGFVFIKNVQREERKNARYFDVGIGSTPDPLLANMAKPRQYLPHREKKEKERGKGDSFCY
jgi:hypothetical protein